jgi:RNA-binding protein
VSAAIDPAELTGSQRKYLRGLAHELDPLVLVGKGGLSEGLLENLSLALEAHELVKVKFNDFKDQKKELAAEIVAKLGAAEVGAIGHVSIFFRPASDPKKRHIELPRGGRRSRPLEE